VHLAKGVLCGGHAVGVALFGESDGPAGDYGVSGLMLLVGVRHVT
jgi:hypothetical protein